MNTCARTDAYFTKSGDRDFSGDIRSLREEGFPTMLFTGMRARVRTHARMVARTHTQLAACMHMHRRQPRFEGCGTQSSLHVKSVGCSREGVWRNIHRQEG